MEVAEDTAMDEAEDAIVMMDGDDKGNDEWYMCFMFSKYARNEKR